MLHYTLHTFYIKATKCYDFSGTDVLTSSLTVVQGSLNRVWPRSGLYFLLPHFLFLFLPVLLPPILPHHHHPTDCMLRRFCRPTEVCQWQMTIIKDNPLSIHYELPPSLKCPSVMLWRMRRAGEWGAGQGLGGTSPYGPQCSPTYKQESTLQVCFLIQFKIQGFKAFIVILT